MYDAETSSDPDREKGISSIANETGCLSINLVEARSLPKGNRFCRLSSDVIGLGEARTLLKCKQTYRFSSDVIGPGEAHRLSLDVIIPDVIICYKWPK